MLPLIIGKLSSKTGLSRDTIRFYEKRGLIQISNKQRRSNNYKEYPDEVLTRLETIKRMKNFGFTLNEVATLLDMIEINEATCNKVGDFVAKKIDLLDKKIQNLIAFRNQLTTGVQKCKDRRRPSDSEDNCPILVLGDF